MYPTNLMLPRTLLSQRILGISNLLRSPKEIQFNYTRPDLSLGTDNYYFYANPFFTHFVTDTVHYLCRLFCD